MEFSAPFAVVVDIPQVTTTNLEDLRQSKLFECPKYVIEFFNFVTFTIIFSVFTALPLIEIVIGIAYVNECSMNYFIPIYLIVAGFISIIILIFAVLGWIFIWPSMDNFKFKTIKSAFAATKIIYKIMSIIAILFFLFGLGWFITGNIWIFIGRSHVQYTNPIGFPNTYCNRVAYLTGFWSIIVKYTLGWIVICRLNCYVCSDIREILKNPDIV